VGLPPTGLIRIRRSGISFRPKNDSCCVQAGRRSYGVPRKAPSNAGRIALKVFRLTHNYRILNQQVKHPEVRLELASRVIDIGVNEILSRQCYSLFVYSTHRENPGPRYFSLRQCPMNGKGRLREASDAPTQRHYVYPPIDPTSNTRSFL